METNQNPIEFSAETVDLKDFLQVDEEPTPEQVVEEEEAVDLNKELDIQVEDIIKEEEEEEGDDTPPKPEEEEEEDSPPPVEESQESKNFKSIINKMVSLGEWDEFDGLEDEEGNLIPLDELNITEEMFDSIVKTISSEKNKKLLDNKEDVSELSDFTKRLIAIEKKGGDIRQALEVHERLVDPLSKIDPSTEEGAIQSLQLMLSTKNYDEETIEALLLKYQKDGVLQVKGEEAYEALNKASQDYLVAMEQKAEQATMERQKRMEDYRKQLRTELKETFKVEDNVVRRLLDAATKETKEGFQMEKLYNETRRDPKQAAELALFLFDKEKYLEAKFREKSNKDKVNTFKHLKLVKSSSQNPGTRKQTRKDDEGYSLEELSETK